MLHMPTYGHSSETTANENLESGKMYLLGNLSAKGTFLLFLIFKKILTTAKTVYYEAIKISIGVSDLFICSSCM